jgi:DNA-binding NarL/FixJ family response regulator
MPIVLLSAFGIRNKGSDSPEIMPKKTKVFLIDDHPLVREWLATLLNRQSDFQVCGEASDGAEAMNLIATAKPDVAIVDISLEGGSGIELIKGVKAAYPNVAMVVLTMHDESLYAERALRAGARGYVMKREATKKIIPAIRRVLEGKLFVSDKFLTTIAERLVEWNVSPGSPVAQLSDREMEVFQMIGQGMETRQIAEAMHVNFKTVQAFAARIKKKLMVSNATELVREAVLWHVTSGGIGEKTKEEGE